MKQTKLLAVGILGLLLCSCTTDNEEELFPETNCITENMSYETHIKPILNRNCTACHNSSFASGGVDLNRYEGVFEEVNNTKLMKSIRHESGVSPMPAGQDKLSECEISQIASWVDAGAPNN